MFSVMRCLQPARSAVERASGYQSRGRSLRAVASAGGRWSSSMVTSLSWRSAIVLLSPFLTPASNSRARLSWLQGNHGQLCVWNKEHWGEFFVFSAVIGVFAGMMSASYGCIGKGFPFAVRDGCRGLASEVGRVSQRTRFKSSSKSAPSHWMLFWSFQVRTRMRCRLPEGSVARSSRKCGCNFWIPQNGHWRRAVVSFARRT